MTPAEIIADALATSERERAESSDPVMHMFHLAQSAAFRWVLAVLKEGK